MPPDLGAVYDGYWRERDLPRARARSQRRAALAVQLLRLRGRERPRADLNPKLLEVGCGPGWALEMFTAAGFDARGIDVSPLAVDLARERGLDVRSGCIEDLTAADGAEVIAALEVLEHTVDPLQALLRLKSCLRPGGRLVVSLPNEFHLLSRAAILLGHPPFGGHRDPHVRHFDDRSARKLFEEAGLEVRGRLADGIIPPRWPLLARILSPLVKLAPGLFALANVYLLEPLAPPPEA